jgi:anti-anti-sigma factor
MVSDDLDQVDIDNLLTQLASSGSRLAAAADGRYRMSLNRRAGVVWLLIEGMVMQPVPDEFTARLRQLCDTNQVGHAVVDLRRCTYLCSSALGVLAMLLQSDRNRPGKVLLLGVSDKIARMMALVGLGELFLNVPDEAAAARYWLALSKARPG